MTSRRTLDFICTSTAGDSKMDRKPHRHQQVASSPSSESLGAAASMVPSPRSSLSSLQKHKRPRTSLSHAPSSISQGRSPLASQSLTCSLNPLQNSLRRSVMLNNKSAPLKGQTELSTCTPDMSPFTLMRKILKTGPIKSPAVFRKSPMLSIGQQQPRIPSSTKTSRRSDRKSLTRFNMQHEVNEDKVLQPLKRWNRVSCVDPQAFTKGMRKKLLETIDGTNSLSTFTNLEMPRSMRKSHFGRWRYRSHVDPTTFTKGYGKHLLRKTGEWNTLSSQLNTLERSAKDSARRRNMRRNLCREARRMTHQGFLKRLQDMDSSNLSQKENACNDGLGNDNCDVLMPNQGQKEDNALEAQMLCSPILQNGMRRNANTVTEYDESDSQNEPASQIQPEGTSSQPSSNRSKAAMNSDHSFESPATAEGRIEEEEDRQGLMQTNEILNESEAIERVITEKPGDGKTLSSQLNTLERSAKDSAQRRNMRRNLCREARRMTHQGFLKRLQDMDSSNLSQKENDCNDGLGNDNCDMLMPNQRQKEDNALEAQMLCSPILQNGMRRNANTVTEYDESDSQNEPTSQTQPGGTSSQPSSNRSKAAMNSGHSFESPATAEGGIGEEEDGEGMVEENEVFNESEVIGRIITENLDITFLLQEEEASPNTSDEDTDLDRIHGILPPKESTLFENLLSFVDSAPDMSKAQKSAMFSPRKGTLFENQLSLVEATTDESRALKFRKANNKSGSTRKVVKPHMLEGTQLSIPGKAIKNVLSRYSCCPAKPAIVRAVQERFPEFLAQMCDDLEAYALHAGRKTVLPADVELLLKRQGHITDTMPLEALIWQHLPMQDRALLIPSACAYNRLEPATKHFKKHH
uniref:uncharacterized protein isoform X2 n=1 Tax=Myxine glutinosa TaxID=7769 RepID=UPI00358FACD0